MEIRPINHLFLEPSESKIQQKKRDLYDDPYELDITINSKETAHEPEETGSVVNCASFGCGQSNYCTQPNSQCICSGNYCGGSVCSHC